MDQLILLITLLAALIEPGQTQLKDPPRSFTRLTSYNCLVYPHAFRCVADGMCIPPERVRDGVADCLDGSDEDATAIDICDYAPYFPDYRCSAYADCIGLPDGYACRCKRGYVGAGELCQPAPLNLPRFMTSPRPLLIQTKKNSNATTTRKAPTLLDLSNEVLQMSNSMDELATSENSVITPWVPGFGGESMNQPTVGTREFHNTTTDTTIGTQGFHISSDFVCPNNTVMINESGQVWCLRLNGGKIRNWSDLNSSDFRVTPSMRPNRVMMNLTTDSATGLAKKIAQIIAKNLSGDSAGSSSFVITTSRQNGSNETNFKILQKNERNEMNEATSGGPDSVGDYLMSESDPPGLPNDANIGTNGYTPGGAFFGYLPTSATSRQPGHFLPLVTGSSRSRTIQGTIITPVKIWNSTGGAITAYRILPNETLPLSCLTATNISQIMFLCADRTSCVDPSKILDAHEDCSDGSDEVPEFIDECAFGAKWPQYKCGVSAKCTDTLKGYTCSCSVGFYWDGNTCTAGNSSGTGNPTTVSSGGPIPANENPNSGNGIQNAVVNASVGLLPTSVDIISYPGHSTWTSNTGTEGKFASQVLQNGPSAVFRRPTSLCVNCLSPEMVTLGPTGLEGEARQDAGDTQTADASGASGVRVLQTGGSSRGSSVPANYVYGQPVSDNVYSSWTQTPGVTIIGTYDPTTATPIRVMNPATPLYSSFPRTPVSLSSPSPLSSPRSPSPLIPNFRRPSNYAIPATTIPPTSGNSDWAAVLDALRRTSTTTPISASSDFGELNNNSGNVVNFPANGDLFGTLGSIQPSTSTGGATLPPNGTSRTDGGSRANAGNSPQTSQPFQFGTNVGVSNGSSQSNGGLPSIFSVGFDPAFGTVNNQGQSGQATGANVSNAQFTGSSTVSSVKLSDASGSTVTPQASASSVAGNAENVTVAGPDDNSASGPISSQTLGNSVNSGAAGSRPPGDSANAEHNQTLSTISSENISSLENSSSVVEVTPANAFQPSSVSFSEYTQYTEYAGSTLPPLSFLSFATAGFRSTALPSTTLSPVGGSGTTSSSSVGGVLPLRPTENPFRSENLIDQNGGSSTPVSIRPFPDTIAFPAGANAAVTSISFPITSPPAVAVIVPFRVPSTPANETGAKGSLGNRPNVATSRSDETGGSTLFPTDNSSGVTMQNSLVSSTVASTVASTVSSTGGINPNLYPTNILWSLPVGRQESMPLSSSLSPLSSNATDVTAPAGNNSLPFEGEYDCFGDLFRVAYLALQKNSRTCSSGCDPQKKEVCVSPDGRCDCVTGTARAGPNGECQAAFQYNVGITMAELCGKPLVFKPFMSDLSNPSTQQLAVVVCYQMEQLISQSSFASRYSPGSCRPLGFSSGSVISNIALSWSSSNATQTTLPFELVQALDKTLSANSGSLSNDTVGFRVKPDQHATNETQASTSFEIVIKDIRECDLGIAMCDLNADCLDSFGSYLCTCVSGYVDLNPSFPGRTCGLSNINTTLAFQNGTIGGCPKEYYRFLNLCLHPAYFILLIIAFVIAGIILLSILGALIACCCRCCNRKRSVLEVPQAALLRAAARSPRASANEPSSANIDYQILKSSVDKSRLDPNVRSLQPPSAGTAPYSSLSNNNLDLEGGSAPGSGGLRDHELPMETKKSSIDVQTWEEVEVPTHVSKEDDELSKRALSPSQGSMRSRTEKLGPIVNEEVLEEKVTTADVQRTEPHELEIPQILSDNASIGSSMDIRRTDYNLPPSPSQSVKGLTSAMHIAKKFHLEAQSSIRKASVETREWQAMPRTESLIKEEGLDVDTLPHHDYSKDPVYEVSSPVQNIDETKLDALDLQRLDLSGIGNRDSFDDVMEQTSRFYQQSSSDIEYEKEGDLSETITVEGNARQPDGRGSGEPKSGAVLQHQPAFALPESGTDDAENDSRPQGSRRNDSQDDDDHMSLKSTDEDELRNLRGSLTSLKSLKINGEISHDSVIDQMVEDQPVFYSPTNDSDEEEYLQRKSNLKNQITDAVKDSLTVTGEPERKTSEIQRDIAIHEFGALGERDSIDDFLDDTAPFFSRASTLDSFQLTKVDSGDDLGPRDSRKTSQSMLSVELNGPADPSPRQRRPLLKKRSAFHSRDSMNKIMEKEPGTEESGIGGVEGDGDVVFKTDLQEESDRQTTQTVIFVSEEKIVEIENTTRFALDDDDINAFFNQNKVTKIEETRETPTSRRNSEDIINQRNPENSEKLEEFVVSRQMEERNFGSRRNSTIETLQESITTVEILGETINILDSDREQGPKVLSTIWSSEGDDIEQVRPSDEDTKVSENKNEEVEVERIEDLERPPSRVDSPNREEQTRIDSPNREEQTRVDSPNREEHSILITPPVEDLEGDKDRTVSPQNSEGPQTARLIQSSKRRDGDDSKSIKSVSDHNLQVGDVDSTGQPMVPHDSDSGVYVDILNADGSRSSAGRQQTALSSQDDLQVFEGQESRRDGSGSSYQRLSQSDDEEEVMKRYSSAYEKKIRKPKRARQNYAMGPPESRHVYYSSRPKRMPPNREELDIWKDSTWWRVRK